MTKRAGILRLPNYQPLRTQNQDLLTALTGHDQEYWFYEVQHLIEASHFGRKVRGHHRNRLNWPDQLRLRVQMEFKGDNYDPNMRTALCMGMILMHWYARIHRAKAMDPNRPLTLRRQAYAAWLNAGDWADRIWRDERADKDLTPQKWNHPFWPGARGGKFV